MTNLNESYIEQIAINILQSLGCEYVFGPDIAPDSKNNNLRIPRIKSFEDDLLRDITARKMRK